MPEFYNLLGLSHTVVVLIEHRMKDTILNQLLPNTSFDK